MTVPKRFSIVFWAAKAMAIRQCPVGNGCREVYASLAQDQEKAGDNPQALNQPADKLGQGDPVKRSGSPHAENSQPFYDTRHGAGETR